MEIVTYWTFFNEATSKQWPKFLWKRGTERLLYRRTRTINVKGKGIF